MNRQKVQLQQEIKDTDGMILPILADARAAAMTMSDGFFFDKCLLPEQLPETRESRQKTGESARPVEFALFASMLLTRSFFQLFLIDEPRRLSHS